MDVQRGATKVVKVVPTAPMVGPTAVVYDRAGTVVASPTATASALSTTTAADTTRAVLKLTSAVAAAAGLAVLVGSEIAVISRVDGVNATLVEPLSQVPADGTAVVGLDVSVSLTGAATTTLYAGYTLEVSATGVDPARLVYNVVRFPFIGPCAARHVRDLLQRGYPGEAAMSRDATLHERIAAEVNESIRGRLLASNHYLSAFWSPDALGNAMAPMLRLVLGERYGLRESGSDRDQYLQSLRFEVRDRIADVVSGGQLYDGDSDGVIPDADQENGRTTIRLQN